MESPFLESLWDLEKLSLGGLTPGILYARLGPHIKYGGDKIMSEQFFQIPNDIVRNGGSLASPGTNGADELIVIDLGKKSFVLQLASVWLMLDSSMENVSAFMIIRDRKNSPVATLSIPIFPSARLRPDGSGIFIGTVNGPIPVKALEKLCFQVQYKIGTGTLMFHANAWGFRLPQRGGA